MDRADSTLFHDLVSDVPRLRASVIELLTVALVAAFGVNLASSSLATWIPDWVALVCGALLISAAILYLVYVRFRSETRRVFIRGFVIADSQKPELLRVPDYELASTAARYMAAAFREKPALKRQWEGEPPIGFRGHDGVPGMGQKLMDELAEYLLLERVSMTLTDHFNTSQFEKSKLREIARNDLPQILLQNRFLELFSSDMKDREGFESPGAGPDSEGTVVMQFSNGHIYSRFELTLPTNCTISRKVDGSLVISSPVVEMCLRARHSRYAMVLPSQFQRLYLGREIDTAGPLELTFELVIKVKKHRLMNKGARNYALWVEDVIKDLNESFSSDVFLQRIHWSTVVAVARVLKDK